MKKYFFYVLLFTIHSVSLSAQKDYSVKKDPWTSSEIWTPVPINRQLSHDKIDNLQAQADAADGKKDSKIEVYGNTSASEKLTKSIIQKVDQYQIAIENLPLDHWKKITQLRNIEEYMKSFVREIGYAKNNPDYYVDLINNYEVLYKKIDKEEPLVDYINTHFSRSLYGSMHLFKDDKQAIDAVYKNMVKNYPDEMIKKFREFSNMEAASDLMTYLAPQKPSLILEYAKSTSAERYAVRKSKDPLVKKIVEIADKSNNSLRAITYLDDLYAGNLTIAQVNEYTKDNASYYRSLVKQRQKNTKMSRRVLERESKLQALEYVRLMNELHDSPDATRFKCIEPLTADEIYYLMVLCSDEIYTSTFVGSFNRMLDKMNPTKGDAFLKQLNNDKFRTFIRMCAGYNKLDEFLKTMDAPNRNVLMNSFVSNIDKNAETDVEDAVDVADAIGSIHDDDLIDFLLERLKENYERTYAENSKRGLITYFLLHTLTTSLVNPELRSEDLQAELKVPPISYVPYSSLTDEGTVYQQVYFYGDEDGKSSFSSFLSNYPASDWDKKESAQWVMLSSKKGNNTIVYANRPLDEPQDEEAQIALNKYLAEQGIQPKVVIHRGHSYHLPLTLKNLKSYNKVVILGSCGGYHNLSSILDSSEDAHIISSKQTGTMHVTDPILKQFNDRMLAGKDVNWIELWDEVAKQMNNEALKDKFNDYVPPHKNMGALYLKAFKIQMAEHVL
ncbi:MAG: hypothetical protein R2831_03010 [Chitinophagaceae bacterium]